MNGPLYGFFREDHRRLGDLLDQATADSPTILDAPYSAFRKGLLRHVSMEERVLLPALQRYWGGEAASMIMKIRLDHGALAALLVPPPSPHVVAALRTILSGHNRLEEGQGGLYELCERAAGSSVGALLKQAQAVPEVPVRPYNPDPEVLKATQRALARAGYTWVDYKKG